MAAYPLDDNFFKNPTMDATRSGFGTGLVKAGEQDENVVALCADLTDSVKMDAFEKAFPDRFIETGIAEQNLVTVASGLARAGKVPFAASYAAFNPGRNWEQIKTTAALNDMPVKVVGAHAGVMTGPDGATHQMLEDIALMRVMPNMTVIVPGDAVEAEKATIAAAKLNKPCYIRLSRDKTPVFSAVDAPFEIGKAYVVHEGTDVTLCATGILTPYALQAAKQLEKQGVSLEVIHVPTIKPLDEKTILASIKKTGRMVTAEDAQVAGGLGGAIAELLGESMPAPLLRIGMHDRYGESGAPLELIEHFGFDAQSIADKVRAFVKKVPTYKPGF